MQLGRVTGTVVATARAAGLEGVKFLIVQPLGRRLEPQGEPVVAADGVAMAGPGELVYFVASREAALALPEPFVPVDHAIVGIVDAVETLAGVEPAGEAATKAATKGSTADDEPSKGGAAKGRTKRGGAKKGGAT